MLEIVRRSEGFAMPQPEYAYPQKMSSFSS